MELALIAVFVLGILLGGALLARRISKRTGKPMMQVLRGGGSGEDR